MQFDRTCPSQTDGLFSAKPMTSFPLEFSKIGRLILIVVEAAQISKGKKFPSKSKAGISDGLDGGLSSRTGKSCADKSACYYRSKQSSGMGLLFQHHVINFRVSDACRCPTVVLKCPKNGLVGVVISDRQERKLNFGRESVTSPDYARR